MGTQRKVNNLLAVAVLCYLTQAPMHAYELSRTLRRTDDARSIRFNHGSLYMVVQQLDKAGFIAAKETSRHGARPERTVFAITDAGRRELHDWMRDLVGEPEHEYGYFVAALSLIAALPVGEVVELLGHRLGRLAERREETLSALAQGRDLHPLFLIEEEYRLALLDAEVGFVRSFLDRITGWAPAWARLHGEVPQAVPGEVPDEPGAGG